MFFLLFLHDDRRIRIREAQKQMDPDPQHCLEPILLVEYGKMTASLYCIGFSRGHGLLQEEALSYS